MEYLFVLSLGKQNFEQEVPKFKIVLVGMYQLICSVVDLLCFINCFCL